MTIPFFMLCALVKVITVGDRRALCGVRSSAKNSSPKRACIARPFWTFHSPSPAFACAQTTSPKGRGESSFAMGKLTFVSGWGSEAARAQ